ncbi:MAG TPA: molecular chaperone TorD family protein [Candidatus Deferrimicrobium sp.]|nr:molecular chaperone TorD family protein [Candidatus Deferrimicrobium sp.]
MSELHELLERASVYRFLSLAFMALDKQRPDQLRAIASELPEEWRSPVGRLVDMATDAGLEGQYHRLLGAQKGCPCCESDYLPEAACTKGVVLSDIAGFYRAFGFDNSLACREAPDHIAVELSFLSFLAFKESFTRFSGRVEDAEVCHEAEITFLCDHFSRWLDLFCSRLSDLSGDGFYGMASRLAQAMLSPLIEGAMKSDERRRHSTRSAAAKAV